MRRIDLRALPLLGAAVIFAAGCDDGPTDSTTGDTSLSDDETTLITDEVANAVAGALDDGFGGAALAGGSVPFSFTRTVVRSCPDGGEVSATVTVSGDVEQGSGELSLEGSTSFTDCTREGPERTLVVNGELSHSGSVILADGDRGASFTTTGTISWDLEPGDEGTCAVDLTVTMEDGSRSITGTVCDREIDRTIS